jgi:hypothetical protein
MANKQVNNFAEQTTLLATDSFLIQKADGTTMRATAADLLAFLSSSMWDQELGRDTITGTTRDTMSVTFTAKKYLYVMLSAQGAGGTLSGQMLFNADTGTNYSDRLSLNGAAETTNPSQSSVLITGAATYANLMFTAEIINIAGLEKMVSGKRWDQGTAGAANLPNRVEFLAKWVNTTDQITTISMTNSGGGDFAIGSELIVRGRN